MRIPTPIFRHRARIEIIPLIDVIFFLLATFMMVSLSMVKNGGIPIHLPAAATAVSHRDVLCATITVTESGDLYLDKQKIQLKDLPARLSALQSAARDLQVVIQGDERGFLGNTIRVLDEVRRAGITKVLVRTRPLSAG